MLSAKQYGDMTLPLPYTTASEDASSFLAFMRATFTSLLEKGRFLLLEDAALNPKITKSGAMLQRRPSDAKESESELCTPA
jgi:hypothetical protein